MFISKVFSFLVVCMLAVCGNSVSQIENTNRIQQKEKTELSLRMERSGCYGTCPIYNLTVHPNGKVLFEDKGYTETIGKAESNISEEKINEMLSEIDKSDFFALKDSYTKDSGHCPATSTDSPTVTLFINLNGKEKIITHYLGCSEKYELIKSDSANVRTENDWSKHIFPQPLFNLESKIDEIVETKRWIGEPE